MATTGYCGAAWLTGFLTVMGTSMAADTQRQSVKSIGKVFIRAPGFGFPKKNGVNCNIYLKEGKFN
jgi:hypothetical protein